MATEAPRKGFLAWVERTGNRLPDPVFMFLYLIGGLVVVSLICAAAALSATHPTALGADGLPRIIEAQSLLSGDNLRRLFVDMPQTFTHFHPLGYVLVVMLGAGVAERSGLFATAMRAAVTRAPKALLTPTVALVAMVSNHAADAAYVVLIPLAGVLFAAAGRHPLVGIAAAFAGVSGGFSANIAPGQLDALLFGITQEAAATVVPGYHANIAGNWYFILALTLAFLPVIWFVTDRMIEPRLGHWVPEDGSDAPAPEAPLTAAEKKGLIWAGLASLGVVAAWVLLTIGPGTPLIDEAACSDAAMAAGTCAGEARLTPLFRSLVAGFLVLFLLAGWAYGHACGSIKDHRDLVKMMTEAMKDLGYYLVLAFVAAHFVAMFNWSNLGLISAVHGAEAIRSSGLPLPIVLGLIVLFTAAINLFVGSASAKWALLAPVLVPMLMLLGVSPEGATAAYRVGDSATNIITPLMVYFPLILIFCQRWKKDFGIGSLTAMMLPYSLWLLVAGLALVIGWVLIGAELGPGSPVDYVLPTR
jgi:aminobenzoyl-glutamate transport protein